MKRTDIMQGLRGENPGKGKMQSKKQRHYDDLCSRPIIERACHDRCLEQGYSYLEIR